MLVNKKSRWKNEAENKRKVGSEKIVESKKTVGSKIEVRSIKICWKYKTSSK